MPYDIQIAESRVTSVNTSPRRGIAADADADADAGADAHKHDEQQQAKGKPAVTGGETDEIRPATRAILPMIHATTYTTAQFPADNHFGAEVKVTMTDGRIVSAKTDQALGRSVDKPLPTERLKEKFDNCAARALPTDVVARLYAAIQGFENAKDVREISALAAGRGGPKRVAA